MPETSPRRDEFARQLSAICAEIGNWMPSARVLRVPGGSKSIHLNLSNFIRQCRSVTDWSAPVVNQRILAVVGEGGIMKQRYHKLSYDASQIYKVKKYVTITFKDSPFFGHKGRILKTIIGRHPELHRFVDAGWREDKGGSLVDGLFGAFSKSRGFDPSD